MWYFYFVTKKEPHGLGRGTWLSRTNHWSVTSIVNLPDITFLTSFNSIGKTVSEFHIDILVQSYLEDLTSQKEIHSHKRLARKFEAPKYGKAEHSEILQEEFTHESALWWEANGGLRSRGRCPGPSSQVQSRPILAQLSSCPDSCTTVFALVRPTSLRLLKSRAAVKQNSSCLFSNLFVKKNVSCKDLVCKRIICYTLLADAAGVSSVVGGSNN